MLKWLAICTPSIVGHLEVHRQRGHSHTHWLYCYGLYKRTCALCSVQWLIQASERARVRQKRDRAQKESTCATSLRPTFTQNSTSDLYFLKRLNHQRKQALQRKVRFFQKKGKKLHITSWVF